MEQKPSVGRTPPIDYVAGLFDGEGCISIYETTAKDHHRPKFQLQVAITMREGWLLGWIAERWGGSLFHDGNRGNPKWAPVTRWRLGDVKAEAFLREIEPHLIAKREQALIALNFRQHSGPKHRANKASIQIRKDCVIALRYANRRGQPK